MTMTNVHRLRLGASPGALRRLLLATGLAATALLASGCASTSSTPTATAGWVLPRTSPEAVGLSSAQLGKLAEVTRGHVASGVVPGAVILVARQGKIAYLESLH